MPLADAEVEGPAGGQAAVESIEHILGLPTLSKVSSANELSDLFIAGQYP